MLRGAYLRAVMNRKVKYGGAYQLRPTEGYVAITEGAITSQGRPKKTAKAGDVLLVEATAPISVNGHVIFPRLSPELAALGTSWPMAFIAPGDGLVTLQATITVTAEDKVDLGQVADYFELYISE